jgi:hypothetical protein
MGRHHVAGQLRRRDLSFPAGELQSPHDPQTLGRIRAIAAPATSRPMRSIRGRSARPRISTVPTSSPATSSGRCPPPSARRSSAAGSSRASCGCGPARRST